MLFALRKVIQLLNNAMPSCFAYGCANSNKKEECKDVRFYRIPSERAHPERRRLWLHAIRRKGEPYGAARICSAHFVSGEFSFSCKVEVGNRGLDTNDALWHGVESFELLVRASLIL